MGKYQAFRALVMCMQGEEFVLSFYTGLNAIWGEIKDNIIGFPCICRTCTKNNNEEKVMLFLRVLHDSMNVLGDKLMMNLVPDLDKVYQLVIQNEKQRNINNNGIIEKSSESTALMTQNKFSPKYSKGTGNTKKPKIDKRCTKCKKPSHTHNI